MSVVVWFRRDLRLGDHLALVEAAGAGPVVPLFVLDPALLGPAGAPRTAFLFQCLRALDESMDGRLVVRSGDPVGVVPAVAAEAGARRVYASWDGGPYGSTRDDRVADALGDEERALALVGSPYAVSPGEVLSKDGAPYRVFSPFSRAWQAHGWGQPVPEVAVSWHAGLPTDGIPDDPQVDATLPPAGERAALDRLEAFLAGPIEDYAKERDRHNRVFNPVTQAKVHDPTGEYVRRWVPELASVAGGAVHEPWKQPGGVPAGYPERIVDHATERADALFRYESLKSRK